MALTIELLSMALTQDMRYERSIFCGFESYIFRHFFCLIKKSISEVNILLCNAWESQYPRSNLKAIVIDLREAQFIEDVSSMAGTYCTSI
ncbi:hypothetical protein JTB14_007001 [Gonioctena quinquepunctata]|nr:hypothetical protein JTB14_007001 [Gonioctena quinquepunctata]